MRSTLAAALCLLAALPVYGGCVLGAEGRPTRSQAMSGPPSPAEETASAGGYMARSPGAVAQPEIQKPPRPSAEHVWLEGYWHWNGVRYEWMPGRWEQRYPPYVRR